MIISNQNYTMLHRAPVGFGRSIAVDATTGDRARIERGARELIRLLTPSNMPSWYAGDSSLAIHGFQRLPSNSLDDFSDALNEAEYPADLHLAALRRNELLKSEFGSEFVHPLVSMAVKRAQKGQNALTLAGLHLPMLNTSIRHHYPTITEMFEEEDITKRRKDLEAVIEEIIRYHERDFFRAGFPGMPFRATFDLLMGKTRGEQQY